MQELENLRVLVVEDDMMIVLLLEDMLSDLGCVPIGPYTTLEAAMEAARKGDFGVALLDVNLGGPFSYPVAEYLQQQDIPFVLTSGYGDKAAPSNHPEWPVCAKPFTSETLRTALALLMKCVSPTSKIAPSNVPLSDLTVDKRKAPRHLN